MFGVFLFLAVQFLACSFHTLLLLFLKSDDSLPFHTVLTRTLPQIQQHSRAALRGTWDFLCQSNSNIVTTKKKKRTLSPPTYTLCALDHSRDKQI